MISIRKIRCMSPMMTMTAFLLGTLFSIAPLMVSMYGRLGFQQDSINQTVSLRIIFKLPSFARIFALNPGDELYSNTPCTIW